MILSSVTEYNSIDRAVDADETVNYPIELLNILDPSGTLPYCLQLSVCSPNMYRQNFDPPWYKMLTNVSINCEGTRIPTDFL